MRRWDGMGGDGIGGTTFKVIDMWVVNGRLDG